MKPSELLSWSLVIGSVAFAPSGLRAAEAPAPNILFILADDMGRGDVSAYNPQSAWKTPGIDLLAEGGVRFSDAHSSSAVCTPSRYSILTGRYPWRSRLKASVTDGFAPPVIESGRLTVAEMLKEHGYSTAMIGKWHLGLNWFTRGGAGSGEDETDGEPQMRKASAKKEPVIVDYSKGFRNGPVDDGFESFLGISASLDMPPYAYLVNDGVETAPTGTIRASKLPAFWRAGPIADGFAHVDVLPRLTSAAVKFIGERDAQKPFFLYLALTAPHTPIVPSKDFAGSTHTTPYGDFCVQVDAAIGTVLNELREKHLDKNTLVVFAADNGCSPSANFEELKAIHHDPQMGLRGEKADIYEGGHRIPFIVRWPGHTPAGTSTDDTICMSDFMATCADILSIRLPDTAAEDSVSFRRVLEHPSDARPTREATVHVSINGSFAIRQGPWKLCLCPDSGGWSDPKPGKAPAGSPEFQLFNLADDPAETTNVVGQHPDIVKRLGLLMKSYVLNGRSTPGAPQANTGGNSWKQLAWMKEFSAN